MQYALNTQERNKAFLIFTGFFLVTTGLIVSAIYFNFMLPEKQMEYLKDKLSLLQSDIRSEKRFAAGVVEINKCMDSLNMKGINVPVAESQLMAKIDALRAQSDNENSFKTMNQVIVENFFNLHKTGNNLKDQNEKSDLIEQLQQKLEKCQVELDGYRQQALNTLQK